MKSCLLPYKESKLNMLDHLVKKGYINSDRVLQGDYYFKGKPYIERLLEDINTNYELALTELFDVKKNYVKSFAGGSDIFISRLEPIEDAFNQIDAKRQELGIYDSRMSIGDYNKSKEATEDESIKPGVLELFEENPELSSIGTPEEYSQYLDSIFPDSKIKDIVYRGIGENNVKLFQYFTNNKSEAYMYAKANITKGGNITERNPISVITHNFKSFINNKYGKNTFESLNVNESDFLNQISETEYELQLPDWYEKNIKLDDEDKADFLALQTLRSVYDTIKIEDENDLDKPYTVNNYLFFKKEYDEARNKLDKYFNIDQLGKIIVAVLDIRNPYKEEIVQEDLQNDRDAYKNGNDGAFLMDGDHFLVKSNTNQIHELGSKQDIEGFKEFLKKDDESIYYKNLEDKIKVLEEDKIKIAEKRRNFREWISRFTTLNEVKNDNQKLLESRRQVFKDLGFTETYDNTFELKTSSYVTLISKKQALDDNPLIRFDGKLTGVKYTQKSVDGTYILTYKLDDITKTSIREAQIKGEMPFTKSDLKETLKSEDFLNSVSENIFDGLSPEETQIIKEKLESGEYNINCKL